MKIFLPRGYKNLELLESKLRTKKEKVWISSGRRRAVRQFHLMAEFVPAYKKFLKLKKIDSNLTSSKNSFNDIPLIDKDNYLRQFSRDELCWNGEFAQHQWVISTTSGSSGVPYYFPRTDLQDKYLTVSTELYLRSNFNIQNNTTLYIDAFPMGAWIGGVFTYESIKQIAEKNYRISIITPGIHKMEVISAIKQLGHDFDQIIIGAYAPFLKDILDDGERDGIKWTDYKIGFVFSAEAFTEKFRDFVYDKVLPKNINTFSLNHYGTVDMGTMAHETPLSILIRRLLVRDNKLNLLFPESSRQPTFAQYNPEMFYFESLDNNLVCTSFSGLPLVRYDLKDYGGVITKSAVFKILRKNGYDIEKLIKQNDIQDTVWELPFVYVYERNDFSVSYYAFLIYPDMIRRALQTDNLYNNITGKFTMVVDYDASGRQQLNIHCELKYSIASSVKLKNDIISILHNALLDESSEYRETFNMVGTVVKPIVQLWPYEDLKYFKPGTKQKWVIKNDK